MLRSKLEQSSVSSQLLSDDRFIAKEVSRMEMDALTKFAPSYFDYMRQSNIEQVSESWVYI